MTDIIVDLPDNLGSITFPEGTPKTIIDKEAGNAYLRLRGSAKGKADASNKSEGIAQAFGGGAFQGAGDEVTAFVRSRLPQFSNWMMSKPPLQLAPQLGGDNLPAQTVSDAPTADQRYDEELSRERAKRGEFAKENPVTSGAATVFGSIAPTIPLALAGVPVAPAMGKSTILNAGKAALTGAGYGGVYGFNEGEGGFDERLKTAGKGAGIGAVAGPAAMFAGQGLGAAGRWAATTAPGQAVLRGVDKVAGGLDRLGSVKAASLSAAAPEGGAPIPGENPATYAAEQIRAAIPSATDAVRQRAAQNIATAVERGKMTAEQAQSALDKLGLGAMLADVNKPLFRSARMTNTLEGETSELAEKVLTDRAKTYNPRLRTAIEGGKSVPEDLFFRGDLPESGGNIFQQTASEVGKRIYQGDMIAGGLKQSPRMRDLMSNPQIDAAIDRVTKSLTSARQGTGREPEAPIEVMHMIKREIQNIGMDATGKPSSTAFQWQRTANDFVKAIKQANPELAKADIAYAKVKGLPDAYEAGLGVFGKDTKSASKLGQTAAGVENLLKTADVMTRNATEFGAVNAGRSATGGRDTQAVSLARDILQSDDVRRKIVATFGDRADEIFNAAETVLRFNKTQQGILGGSQTADKAAESGAGMLEGLTLRASPSGIIPRWIEGAGDLLRNVAAPNERVRNQMGQMLLNPSAADNAVTLSLVEDILRRRAAQREGGAVWGGLAGGYEGTKIP